MSAGGPAVSRVLERVTGTVRRHRMMKPGDRVLVAVSGGPDSSCLLHALHRLRRLLEIQLTVFHFDHRLRPGSAEDAGHVSELARSLGLELVLRQAADAPARGDSVEDWAHRAREAALLESLEEVGARRAATGHTLDDQAETVLLALIRGGGLSAVAGIRPMSGSVVRPLIDLTRDEVLAFCRQLDLRPRFDPTNEDQRLLRNAIRHSVIPAMERAAGREIRETVARTAGLLREDADYLEEVGDRALARLTREGADPPRLPARDLTALPRPIAGRAVRRLMRALGVDLPTTEQVEAILDLAAGRPGRRRSLPQGLLAVRDREYVRLSRPSPEKPDS
jgi:tRNA(Ile)-lysidine synthase